MCAAVAPACSPLPPPAVGRLTSPDPATTRERSAREARVRALFSTAAQYICLAAALQQAKDIYKCGRAGHVCMCVGGG